MTNIVAGSDIRLYRSKQDIIEYALKGILANKKRHIGTEWEMFFISPSGQPINPIDGQKAFTEFKRVFKLMGYESEDILERTSSGTKIIGLNIQTLGIILPEIGHQFEFACSVCENCEEIFEKNGIAFIAMNEVARRLGYTTVFNGHVPGYATLSQGTNRSRSAEWRTFYDCLPESSYILREALEGTASSQVTIDSGSEEFHNFFRALLLIEPALSLYYANSDRSNVWVEAYGSLIPSQVKPLAKIWNARNAREAVEIIVDRFLEVDVFFLPNQEWPDTYKAEPFVKGRPTTVGNLMKQDRLSEKILNNMGTFMLMRPAFRKFQHGLIEVRGIDCQSSPELITEIASRITELVYNDEARNKLLADYDHLTEYDIEAIHKISTLSDKNYAMSKRVEDLKISDFVNDIIGRSTIIQTFENKKRASKMHRVA